MSILSVTSQQIFKKKIIFFFKGYKYLNVMFENQILINNSIHDDLLARLLFSFFFV